MLTWRACSQEPMAEFRHGCTSKIPELDTLPQNPMLKGSNNLS
jgi:hypothetical protein